MTRPEKFLSQKALSFRESVIREMSRLCTEANGVNLAQGFPDDDPDPIIKEAAKRAIDEGYNQYAVTWGAPQFRRAIAEKVTRFNGIPTDADRNLTVTCGATEAMICALLAVIDPGDEVILFEPFYENFGPDCILAGAKPVYVALREEGGNFVFDPDELRRAFGAKTKAIVINSPHNPLGKVFTRSELEAVAKLCQEFDCLAITDEIYEYIIYDGAKHVSLGSLPGMAERTITISGCSKTYSVTGWRLAYLVAPEGITQGLRKVHDFLTVGAPHPLQVAGATMLGLPDTFYENLKQNFQTRRNLLLGILKEAGFVCYTPQGAYYVLTDIAGFLGKTLQNDDDFAKWLVKVGKVAAVPGSSFYKSSGLGKTKLRFTFSKKIATLEKAGENLRQLKTILPD